MSKYITVKYFAESEYAKEPYQATEGAAGYDLFAETKTLFPKSTDTISLDGQFQLVSMKGFSTIRHSKRTFCNYRCWSD